MIKQIIISIHSSQCIKVIKMILVFPWEDVEVKWYREHPTKGVTFAGIPPSFKPGENDKSYIYVGKK